MGDLASFSLFRIPNWHRRRRRGFSSVRGILVLICRNLGRCSAKLPWEDFFPPSNLISLNGCGHSLEICEKPDLPSEKCTEISMRLS